MKTLKLIPILIILVMSIAYADLSDFPDQFMSSNGFDGVIVIGEQGSARDYVSGLELAIGLQSTLVGSEGGSVTETSSASSDVFQIKTSDNMLESSEPMSDVIETLTDEELSILADGQLRNERGTFDYEQFIELGPSGWVTFGYQDDIPDTNDDIPTAIMEFNDTVYEYQLVFPTPLESEIDTAANGYVLKDLEDKKITILGNEYTIISTTHDAQNSISIDLLGGSLEDTMDEYQTKTYSVNGEEYEVEVVAISGDPNSVIFKVNGEVCDKLEEGDTYTLSDGTELGVKVILENEGSEIGSDIVTFYIGAKKITLTDTNISDDNFDDAYQIDNDDVDETYVKITGIDTYTPGDNIKIESINVKFTPEDHLYLAEHVKLSDILEDKNQIFTQGFDISYDGFDMDAYDLQDIILKPVGDDEYQLVFRNGLDQELKVPLFYQGLDRLGDTDDELHIIEGEPIAVDEYFVVTSDAYLGIPAAKGNTHLLRYEGQDVDDDQLEFTNLGNGETITVSYDDGDTTAKLFLNNVVYDLEINDTADDGTILVDLDNSGSIVAGEKTFFVTKAGHDIDVETQYIYATQPMIDVDYRYRQLTLTTGKKESGTAGAAELNGALYALVGTGIQANYNLLGAAFGLNITSNPVAGTDSVSEFHDSVRITVEQDGDELDIASVERCLDLANPTQLRNAVTTAYDTTIATMYGVPDAGWASANLSVNPIRYPTLAENVERAFMDGACYPTWTNDQKFMWKVGETDDKQGMTSYAELVQLTDKANGPDQVDILSPDKQVELFASVEKAGAESTVTITTEDTLGGRINGAYLDSDITQISDNMILIGGPCSNQVTAKVMGYPTDCGVEFEAGKGRIKLMQYEGKNVLIVAGYTEDDTLRAAKAVGYFPDYSFYGNDLQVTADGISDYVLPDKSSAQPQTPVATPEPTPEPVVEAPAAVELNCPGDSGHATGGYDTKITKFGIKREGTTDMELNVDGLSGSLTYYSDETFKPQYGVDWLQHKVHVMKGDCNGEEVTELIFKWEDGDKDKTNTFTLPEAGCYCLKVTADDLTIDDASIEMTSDDGEWTMDFATS